MSRWVDVRVLREDAVRSTVALLAAHGAPLNFSINFAPPAAVGEESEVSVEAMGEADVRRALEEQGISVLAIRERLDTTLVIAANNDVTVTLKLPEDPHANRLALEAMAAQRLVLPIHNPKETLDD